MTVRGYWRVSCGTTQDQERQVLALEKANCEVIYGDKITGTSNYGDREELSKCLEELQEGDLLILEDLTRLGRTMVTMLVEVNKLIERGIFIKTLDGRLDTSLMNEEIVRLIVGVMGYSAECELRNIRHRTSEGRAVARSRGVKFGAKRKYDKFQIEEIMNKRNQGIGYGSIAKSMGMSKSTVQTIIQREGVAA
jgi:DNA invertase Pin-like site-specific DNA recombinase